MEHKSRSGRFRAKLGSITPAAQLRMGLLAHWSVMRSASAYIDSLSCVGASRAVFEWIRPLSLRSRSALPNSFRPRSRTRGDFEVSGRLTQRGARVRSHAGSPQLRSPPRVEQSDGGKV